jgi:hypothetical protein
LLLRRDIRETVPGQDPAVELEDLRLQRPQLAAEGDETWPHHFGYSIVAYVSDDSMVVTVCMIGSCESWSFSSTHILGTHVPVEEPSTASFADIPKAD